MQCIFCGDEFKAYSDVFIHTNKKHENALNVGKIFEQLWIDDQNALFADLIRLVVHEKEEEEKYHEGQNEKQRAKQQAKQQAKPQHESSEEESDEYTK